MIFAFFLLFMLFGVVGVLFLVFSDGLLVDPRVVCFYGECLCVPLRTDLYILSSRSEIDHHLYEVLDEDAGQIHRYRSGRSIVHAATRTINPFSRLPLRVVSCPTPQYAKRSSSIRPGGDLERARGGASYPDGEGAADRARPERI